jgi:hypothetical protein
LVAVVVAEAVVVVMMMGLQFRMEAAMAEVAAVVQQ